MNTPQHEQGRMVCIREANDQLDSWYYRNTVKNKTSSFKISPKLIKVIVSVLFLFSLYLPREIFAKLHSPVITSPQQLISPIPQGAIVHNK